MTADSVSSAYACSKGTSKAGRSSRGADGRASPEGRRVAKMAWCAGRRSTTIAARMIAKELNIVSTRTEAGLSFISDTPERPIYQIGPIGLNRMSARRASSAGCAKW